MFVSFFVSAWGGCVFVYASDLQIYNLPEEMVACSCHIWTVLEIREVMK